MPPSPKRTLIDIAARKQERGMLTAYEAYKASVNPEKKEKTGEAPTKAQNTLKAVEVAQKKIETLVAGELSAAEKKTLTAALTGMQGAIETLLAALKKKNLA